MIQIPGNDIFIALATWTREIMLSIGLDPAFIEIVMAFIRALLLGTMALLVFMLITWLERKVVARIQDRIGPNLAGPWGLLQPIADGIKAITKEDTTPATMGDALKMVTSAPLGVVSSLVIALMPSAIGCNRPHGPARLGPMRS